MLNDDVNNSHQDYLMLDQTKNNKYDKVARELVFSASLSTKVYLQNLLPPYRLVCC